MEDKLGRQIMKKVVVLSAKTYSYLKTIMTKINKQKGQKSVS